MFGFGVEELVVILVILLLLFGGKKLPELSRSLGESINELRHAMNDEPEAKTKKAKKDA